MTLSVQILTLLLPGVLGVLLIERLTTHIPWTSFRFTIYSFVLGLASYAVLECFAWILSEIGWISHLDALVVWQGLNGQSVSVPASEVLFATLIAVVSAVFIVFAAQRRWVHRVFSYFRVSQKYGEEALFYYFLEKEDRVWATVRMHEADLMLQGAVLSFSRDDCEKEVVLCDVEVRRLSDGELHYHVQELYLSLPHQNSSWVEFGLMSEPKATDNGEEKSSS